MRAVFDGFPHYIDQACVAFGIAVFVVVMVTNRVRKRQNDLATLLAKMFAASAFPVGVVLLLCAFKRELINTVPDLGIYLAAAGLALLYVSYSGVVEDERSSGKK